MAKSDDPECQIWGTLEELLLAFAVGRHGARRWESVAMEIRSRSPFPHLITPQRCRQRYGDLQRRFSAASGGADALADVPWLEELRKLRVAELRREIERYDLSIGSLQLKVRKLQEERERSIRESLSSDEKPDRPAEERPPSGSTPDAVAGDRICDKVSGPFTGSKKEEIPCKEGHKPAEAEDGDSKPTDSTSGVGGGGEKASPTAREGSCNGSTEEGAASRPQSGESVAESSKRDAECGELQKEDGDDQGEKESSDVQSSASLSRKLQQQRGRRRRKAVVSGGSSSVGGELEGEAEAEEVSGANNGSDPVESGPLISFLEILRSDKHGSVFDHRLDSQESEEYRSLIRQHVDLEMVQSRIDRIGSGHPYTAAECFRDLMLLCNNALVFYPNDAPEFVAALHLRDLISRRMASVLRPPALPKGEATPTLPEPKATASKPKLEVDIPLSPLGKTAASTPLIACRKRSAVSNKAAAAILLKEEELVEEEEDKPETDKKSEGNDEKWQGKKTTKEKQVLSGTTRGLRTSKTRSGHGNGGAAAGKKPSVVPTTNLKSKPVEGAAMAEATTQTEKKTVGGTATPAALGSKKQSAASFLNRMNNSNGSTAKAAETVKNSSAGRSGKRSNQKKSGKGEMQKDLSSGQGSAAASSGLTKRSEEMNGGKRSVGRPPKRSAPPRTPPPWKRAREETEVAAPSRHPTTASRKRGRR